MLLSLACAPRQVWSVSWILDHVKQDDSDDSEFESDDELPVLKQAFYPKHEESEAAEDRDEFGFYYKGREPTLYGDWSHKGRATDF